MLLDRYDLFRWFDRHLRDSVPGQVVILGPPDTEGGLEPAKATSRGGIPF